MYFNSTLTDSSKLLKPLLVFTYTISAIICGLTRIIQYKNHAIDVYSGFLLGSAVAFYLVAFQIFTVGVQCSSIGIPPWCRLGFTQNIVVIQTERNRRTGRGAQEILK